MPENHDSMVKRVGKSALTICKLASSSNYDVKLRVAQLIRLVFPMAGQGVSGSYTLAADGVSAVLVGIVLACFILISSL